MTVVDLFAGPGGWDEAAVELGLWVLGLELDPQACATRVAAGHETLQADVATLDPCGYPCEGLIASPPCPTFSAAGGRNGKALTDVIVGCLRDLADGRDTRAERREEAFRRLQDAGDEKARRDANMSLLVVEPLRWALALEPEWVALEQVPEVLPLWEVVAEILRGRGYNVWTGVLSAERYGVPQTRKRAILMARRGAPVAPPEPTHQAYVPGEPPAEQVGLFGTLEPWVSMAEALGWGMTARPSAEWVTDTGNTRSGSRSEGRSRRTDEPAPVVTSRADQLERRDERPEDVRESWPAERPATTVCGDPRLPPPGYRGGKAEYEAGEVSRSFSPPAEVEPTRDEAQAALEGCGDPLGLKGDDWPERRPATTIAGDPRAFQPGGHHGNGEQSKNAVRLTVEEAAVLQGFRPDYLWQGTSTAKFQQVGNAIPPPLARAVLAVLVG